MSRLTLSKWIKQIESEIAMLEIGNYLFRKEITNGTVRGNSTKTIKKGKQKLELLKELQRYKELEEQGRLIELDDSLPAKDELDRCTRRNCNKCDKYRRELAELKGGANDGNS